MVVTSKSAVHEDSGEAGRQVCRSWPQAGTGTAALCAYRGTRVMVGARPGRPEPCVLPPLLAAKSDRGGESQRVSNWRSTDTSQWSNCKSPWLSMAWVSLAGQAFNLGSTKALGCSTRSLHSRGARPCSPRPLQGWHDCILWC